MYRAHGTYNPQHVLGLGWLRVRILYIVIYHIFFYIMEAIKAQFLLRYYMEDQFIEVEWVKSMFTQTERSVQNSDFLNV